MKTLAIETSCDDTSLSIVSFDWEKFNVDKILLYSQIESHKKYGWVVPELASRLHEQKIMDLLEEIGLDEIKKVDFISYTCCPWLPGSLLVGTTLANTLSLFLDKDKVPVNHIHWHIFSIFCERKLDDIQFPLLVLTVSGWHNDMYIVDLRSEEGKWGQKRESEVGRKWIVNRDKLEEYLDKYSRNYWIELEQLIQKVWPFKIYKIGMTLDDAAWEAFDKVSKMLWWPYPWWKWIYETAKQFQLNSEKWIVKSENISFPRIYLKKDEFNFSFSGLKAQVNYKIAELKEKYWDLSEELICKVAYEFQQAAVETLWKKLLKAANYFWIENIALTGWVSANLCLRNFIENNLKKYGINNFYYPIKPLYSTDNAAMIWVAGILKRGENLEIRN